MKKVGIWCSIALCLLVLLTPAVHAEGGGEDADVSVEAGAVREEWEGFWSAIPPEIADLLPESFFSENAQDIAGGVKDATSLGAILSVIGRITGCSISENLSMMARIFGILLISAVFRSLCAGYASSAGVKNALSLCSSATMVVLIFGGLRTRFSEISAFFCVIQDLSVALLPLMGALYAMGGNVGAAAANHAVMTGFLSILQAVVSGTVLPVAGICLALALLDAVSGNGSLRSLAGLIKKTYTLTLSFLMLLLCGVLGMQSTLAKAGDTLALRTARFAAGSFLPVVGGSVSETLRTVAGSVQYLRGVAGTGAILVLLFAFLPVFLSVLLNRITFMLCGAAAKLLHCDAEEKVLSELSSVYGYFLAVIASLFVVVTFSLTLFSRCAAAG